MLAISQPPAPPKENLTAREAAGWLGISERTVWQRIDEIPHFSLQPHSLQTGTVFRQEAQSSDKQLVGESQSKESVGGVRVSDAASILRDAQNAQFAPTR